MVFKLRADLVRHQFSPRDCGKVQVLAERTRKCFRLDEVFIQVPHEAIAYPVRVCLELYAYGYES